MRLASLSAALVAVGLARAAVYDTRFSGVTWDDTNWIISNTNLTQGEYESRISLANGYLGINLAALGPFFEVDNEVAGDNINGWPLFDRRQTFATIAGFYDSQATTNGTNFAWLLQYGGESVISGVPHWAGLHVEVGGQVLSADTPSSQISNFTSQLDIGNGQMIWTYTWTPSSNGSAIDVQYTMFVNKLYVNQAAVQLQMTAKQATTATVIDVLNGDCAVRSDLIGTGYAKNSSVIWSAVSPHWLPDIKAYIYSSLVGDNSTNLSSRKQYTASSVIGSNSSSVAQAVTVNLQAGQTSTITKYIGGASSDGYDNPQVVAANASMTAASLGYNTVFAAHSGEWHNVMSYNTVEDFRDPSTGALPNDENVIELAITAVSSPFYLLQNTISANALSIAGNQKPIDVNSISVSGLGSSSYAGWIFWDAEVWMAPGLVVAYPDAAKQIAAYRSQHFEQAQKNIATAYQSSKNKTFFSPTGAVFPWVSGRFGNCTAAGPCFDYEYHINGDIGLEVYNYYAVTGDSKYFGEELFPLYDAVAQFYSNLVTYNSTAGKYYLYNATDPDEYANFEENVGYTMVLMKTHIDNANLIRESYGIPANASWANVSSLIEVPIDQSAGIIKEYQTMNGSIQVKQADIVLIDDFLDYPNPYTLNDLEFYAGKQSLNGPGMTYAVFSIVSNAHSLSGCESYTYDLYGSQPYTRAPWFQFSEQLLDNYEANGGTHPAYPFLTGHGGANRVAVFGYLGLHLLLDTLSVDPNLPPQIPNLSYRTIYWQGWPVKAVSNQTHTTLTRTGTALSTANSTYASSSIPVTIGLNGTTFYGNATRYSLPPNGTITIPNRQIGSIKTVPGNIAQCQPVNSTQSYEPGQFPLAAVDGAVSTKWQPTNLNQTSSITVELSQPYVPISQIKFDWAQSPPASYKVTFSNSSDGSNAVSVASSNNVTISNPYVAANADQVTAYMSNTTNVTLSSPVWSGKYATLQIQGNLALVGTADAKNGTGASVAEFAIVAQNSPSNSTVVRRNSPVRLH